MAYKFVVFAALVAAVRAGGLIASAPLAAPLAAPIVRAAPLAAPILRAAPLAAPLAVARAAPLAVAAAPVAKAVVAEEYDPNPQYSYGYDVQDALTGDSKNQVESRNGDVVQGSYSLTDPDGTRRTVEYTADPINGFNAVVHREPLVAAKAVVAAPAVAKVAAPVAVAAPVLRAAPAFAAAPIYRAAAPAIAAAPVLRAAAPAYAAPLATSTFHGSAYAAAAPVAKIF